MRQFSSQNHNAVDLITKACSCAHNVFKSKTKWRCGTCSQCIDQRIAILSAGLENFDLETGYVCDVFTGHRKDGYEQNIDGLLSSGQFYINT